MSSKWLIVLLGCLGLLFLLWGSGGEETKPTTKDPLGEDYRSSLQTSLEVLLADVAGVGEVSVLVTLAGGEEYIYASDITASGNTDYVTSSGKGLLLGVKAPEVSGVAVVCVGGDNLDVQEAVISLVRGTLGIPSSRIVVCAGNLA